MPGVNVRSAGRSGCTAALQPPPLPPLLPMLLLVRGPFCSCLPQLLPSALLRIAPPAGDALLPSLLLRLAGAWKAAPEVAWAGPALLVACSTGWLGAARQTWRAMPRSPTFTCIGMHTTHLGKTT